MQWAWIIGVVVAIYFGYAALDTIRDRMDRRTRRVLEEELIRRRLL